MKNVSDKEADLDNRECGTLNHLTFVKLVFLDGLPLSVATTAKRCFPNNCVGGTRVLLLDSHLPLVEILGYNQPKKGRR